MGWDQIVLMAMAGVALSAAAGFRVFVPFLVASLATRAGYMTVEPDMAWIATTPALVMFGIATVTEMTAAEIPWLDHLLDVVALPAAAIAGVLMTAAFVVDVDPWFRWTMATIAGAGVSTATHLSMATIRSASTTLTGGLANPVFAALETLMALVTAVLAVIAPLLVVVAIVVLVLSAGRYATRATIEVDLPL